MVEQNSQTAGPALKRLREITGGAHQSLETALGLMNADLSRYREWVADFFGFYEPIEQHAACYAQPGWLDAVDRRKTPLLRSDLGTLGLDNNAVATLPRCTHLPAVAEESEQLGLMYVLEGSTLGGQHIARRLLPTLGLSPEAGGQFFSSYRQHVGIRWRELLRQLELRLQTPAARDIAANNALRTFQTLQIWLTRRTQSIVANQG